MMLLLRTRTTIDIQTCFYSPLLLTTSKNKKKREEEDEISENDRVKRLAHY